MAADTNLGVLNGEGTKQYKGTRRVSGSVSGSYSRIVLFTIVIFSHFLTICDTLYIDCATVQKCICEKVESGEIRIECPNDRRNIYPIELTIGVEQRFNISNQEAKLQIKCGKLPNNANPWSYITELDLSEHQIYATIVGLQISYCPPVEDGWKGLLKKLNLSGTDIESFSFITDDMSDTAKPVIIPPNFFSQMPNIRILNLRNNKLTSIPSTLPPKLTSLNLRINNIEVVPVGALSQSTQLKSIGLTSNKIREISPRAFPDSLEHLELNGNKISYLNSSMFSNLKKLKRLYLSSNAMDRIDADTFDGMSSLEELLLNDSTMMQYPNFMNMPTLVNLTISYNPPVQTQLEDATVGTTTLAPDYPSEHTLVLRNLSSLENLKLSRNRFTSLPVLENLPKLVKIDLGINDLTEIKTGAFAGLPSLMTLLLNHNKLTTLGVIKAVSLNTLDLSHNKLTSLSNNTFNYIGLLETLKLANNQIEIIDDQTLEPLGNLQHIDLSYNKITFSLSPYNSMEGDFFGISSSSPFRRSYKMKEILLSHNNIARLDFSDWAQVFTQVSYIDLSYNKIQSVTANSLNFISFNLTLNLEHNLISTVDLQYKWLLTSNADDNKIIRVLLGANPLKCDCFAYDLLTWKSVSYDLKIKDVTCGSPPQLKGRKLTSVPEEMFLCDMDNKKSGCPELCSCKQRTYDKTVLVNCSSLNLTWEDIPQLNTFKKVFSDWDVEVDLSYNQINFADDHFLKFNLNKTTKIDLIGNNLTSTQFLERIADYQRTTFLLAKNPFSCTNCIGFQIPWRAYPTRIRDLVNVTCRRDSDNVDGGQSSLVKVQENNKEFENLCANPSAIAVTVIAPLLIAVIFLSCLCIGLFVTIRYGWAIKAYVYSKGWNWCLFWERDLDEEEETDGCEKLYDAFVSYSHKDEEWVLDELVNKLEGQGGFKLCLHFRDWTPGDWIPDQIVRSVDKSRRTVVVLSKNFVESVWSRLEFKAAHAQALKERSNRVILIMLGEDLKESDVQDDDLKVYMKMNTFMKWNDPLFWHRLKYALPHKKPHSQQTEEEIKQNAINKMQQRDRAIKLDKLRAKLEQSV